MTVKPPLSVDLVARCANAAKSSFREGGYPIYSPDEGSMSDVERERWETLITAVEAAIREAGFCELVAALLEANPYVFVKAQYANDDDAKATVNKIDAALRKAGELP